MYRVGISHLGSKWCWQVLAQWCNGLCLSHSLPPHKGHLKPWQVQHPVAKVHVCNTLYTVSLCLSTVHVITGLPCSTHVLCRWLKQMLMRHVQPLVLPLKQFGGHESGLLLMCIFDYSFTVYIVAWFANSTWVSRLACLQLETVLH